MEVYKSITVDLVNHASSSHNFPQMVIEYELDEHGDSWLSVTGTDVNQHGSGRRVMKFKIGNEYRMKAFEQQMLDFFGEVSYYGSKGDANEKVGGTD